MEIFGIKFAPLYVPWKRRMETLSVAVWVFLLGFGNLCSVILTIYLLYCSQITRYLMLLYFVWMYYDWDTCDKGGRSERWINWFLNSAYVRNLADYFPTQLVKTVDLDPNESYLFCVIPHGIVSIGIAGSFMAHKSRYKKLFPGIESRVVILDQHFRIPFLREYTNLFGTISCHPKSVDYRLSMKPVPPYTGKATVLIVGGAAESLESKPGTYRTLLKERKGFVRLALKHGTQLVPVISFGETNTFEQCYTRGTRLRKVQNYIRKMVGVAPVLISGRGFFQYNFGLIPYRTPITVVVGAPLKIPKIEEPTNEEINEYHQKFIDSVVKTFEAEKHKYIENADSVHIEFV
ncbi:unnamed protein product [Xylocopa violacea]|uniref:Acyltransferase n=1 Tax=Xylocopa violacea TaxID=135666 RepID=A0ABP1MZJ8_XYLVO